MTRPTKLTKKERRLTAIQYGIATDVKNGVSLRDYSPASIDRMVARKLLDRVGRKSRASSLKFVLTKLGEAARAYYEAHTGRATR